MPLIPALETWMSLVAACSVTLSVAIIAGRSIHTWQRVALLILELFGAGAVLVLWMFQVWFIAKVLIAVGMAATPALVAALVCGVALGVLAGCAGGLIVFVAYAITGSRARFREHLRSSLWISRGYTFRPRDFSRG